MERVEVTKPMIGIYAMQACAINDATDEEILRECNIKNPCGTSHGWTTVVREDHKWSESVPENCAPVKCSDDENRVHFIVIC